MLGNAVTPHDDIIDDDPDFPVADETVPGLPGLLMGVVLPKPYPINIYNFDGQKESGLAGTLYPDGEFVPLPARNIPRGGEHFDEELKRRVAHTVVWDGSVVGSVELSLDPDQPHTRRFDGSLIGPWPLHPPKPDRIVNPEKAREAALENERDARASQGGVI